MGLLYKYYIYIYIIYTYIYIHIVFEHCPTLSEFEHIVSEKSDAARLLVPFGKHLNLSIFVTWDLCSLWYKSCGMFSRVFGPSFSRWRERAWSATIGWSSALVFSFSRPSHFSTIISAWELSRFENFETSPARNQTQLVASSEDGCKVYCNCNSSKCWTS